MAVKGWAVCYLNDGANEAGIIEVFNSRDEALAELQLLRMNREFSIKFFIIKIG